MLRAGELRTRRGCCHRPIDHMNVCALRGAVPSRPHLPTAAHIAPQAPMSSSDPDPLAKALPIVALIVTQGDEPVQMANRIYHACAPCDKTLEQRVPPDFEFNPDYEDHIKTLCSLATQGAEQQLTAAVRELSIRAFSRQIIEVEI